MEVYNMMHGLEFSKQAIIDFNNLKDKVASNQAVFIIIDKNNYSVLRIINSLEEVEKEIDNLQGHYRFGQLHFDIVGIKEIRDKLPYLN